jgi:hypothetical protein
LPVGTEGYRAGSVPLRSRLGRIERDFVFEVGSDNFPGWCAASSLGIRLAHQDWAVQPQEANKSPKSFHVFRGCLSILQERWFDRKVWIALLALRP